MDYPRYADLLLTVGGGPEDRNNLAASVGTYWYQTTKPSFRITYLSFITSPFEGYQSPAWRADMYNVAEMTVRYAVDKGEYKPATNLNDMPRGYRSEVTDYSDSNHPPWNDPQLWKYGDGSIDTWSNLSLAENTADAEIEKYICGLAIYNGELIGWDGWRVSRWTWGASGYVPSASFVQDAWAEASAEEALTQVATQWLQEQYKAEAWFYAQYRAMTDEDLLQGKAIMWRPHLYNPGVADVPSTPTATGP